MITLPDPELNRRTNADAEAIPNEKVNENKTIVLNKKDYRLLGVFLVMFLIIVAIIFMFLPYMQNNTPLQNCEGIVYQAQRNSCIQNLAITNDNVTVCKNLPQTNEYACITDTALKYGNVSACTVINQSKISSECITNVAIENKEIDYCNKLINTTSESNCIYNVSKSGYLGSISYCNVINNKTEKYNCRYIYYFDTALSQKNVSYCSQLPDVITNSIVNKYTLINSYPHFSNASFIFTIYAANLTDQQTCHTIVSKLLKSPIACQSLNNTSKTICSNQSIPTRLNGNMSINYTNFINLCSGINKSKNYFLCMFSSLLINSSKSDNYSVCLSSSNQNFANLCLINLAVRYNDTTDCNYIQNSTTRSLCINNVTK